LRATFANPQLLNELARDANGELRKGSYTKLMPEGRLMRMWEAIETHMGRSQNLIIIAGADYGQGSSRDWAAKGVRLAGVEVIVAEGFERIHRSNLVGMGVLPLQFLEGTTRHDLSLDGSEQFDVQGSVKSQAQLTLLVRRTHGGTLEVPVLCRLDSDEDLTVYQAGGILLRFAQDFLRRPSTS
jgi:2-methylcitrate dehydratase (2-methyl-trans-aconitate forming)